VATLVCEILGSYRPLTLTLPGLGFDVGAEDAPVLAGIDSAVAAARTGPRAAPPE